MDNKELVEGEGMSDLKQADALLGRRIQAEFQIARRSYSYSQPDRVIFACPDELWQIALAAHRRSPELVCEPFPEGHVIFEGSCADWEIVGGQTVLELSI